MNEGINHTASFINNQKSVAIVTESVSQLPAGMAHQLDITVIPMTIVIDGKPYLDSIDLTPKEIYHRMQSEMVVPTSTAPTPAQYQEAFTAQLLNGHKSVLCITLSSKLSRCYSSACLAAEKVCSEFPECSIEVLDSRKAAIAQGFVAIRAAEAANQAKSLPEVLQAAREACRHTNIVATLDTLEYLERGGRIGKLTYMLGSLIDIKPVLTIDIEGNLGTLRKVRDENQSLEAIVDQVIKDVDGRQQLHLAVIDADAPEQAAKLKELALAQLHPDEIFESELTPVMSVHAGPGTLGLGYYFT